MEMRLDDVAGLLGAARRQSEAYERARAKAEGKRKL